MSFFDVSPDFLHSIYPLILFVVQAKGFHLIGDGGPG